MKKYLLISLISLFFFKGNSQSIFPESGTVWLYESWDLFIPVTEKFTALGDTLISNKNFTKVYSTRITNFTNYSTTNLVFKTSYIGAYRTVNEIKKVYYIPKDSANEYILIDFSLKIRDAMPYSSYRWQPSIILKKIDTIYSYCKNRIRQTFEGSLTTRYNVEGIGSILPSFDKIYRGYGPDLYPVLSCFQTGVTKLENNFSCKGDSCTIDNLIESEKLDHQLLIYPNPTSGVISFYNSNSENISVYNSVGQLVFEIKSSGENTKIDLSNYPKGYYIVKSGNRINKVILE